MNNKKALNKTFWNIWGMVAGGVGNSWRLVRGFVWGEMDYDRDVGENEMRKI
ncbi:hypothetical protein [Klebsiella pneumoniae]|uniref:hypothetical protein n=1 Tax=Klebsiella pneumoniae TaxID=573 RepID=UPI0012FE821F|nr:hypothetical protein [Klebsiella pneumoniae]